jgi:DNA-binding response OmpR family regulator
LIADPDDRVLGTLGSAAQSAGYAVTTVYTGQALLEAARHTPVHIVALSMDLPDMGPMQVIEQLHAASSGLPVVLIARHGADPRQDVLRQAVSACVFKPVDAARFVGVCERILRLSDQRLRDGDWRSEPRCALRAEVTVDIDATRPLHATLVNLSARGFRIELPQPVGMGRTLRVAVQNTDSSPRLTFEGRVLWEKPMPMGMLAGGDMVRVSPEDQRGLAALLPPLLG